jgi:hypothetical protein
MNSCAALPWHDCRDGDRCPVVTAAGAGRRVRRHVPDFFFVRADESAQQMKRRDGTLSPEAIWARTCAPGLGVPGAAITGWSAGGEA